MKARHFFMGGPLDGQHQVVECRRVIEVAIPNPLYTGYDWSLETRIPDVNEVAFRTAVYYAVAYKKDGKRLQIFTHSPCTIFQLAQFLKEWVETNMAAGGKPMQLGDYAQ